ncbi:MAG: fibronectin type III domain-containing protein [Actinomycetota bacterium]|nr:fibronectin type III domain-containing protein [Actinomycetota bacterium]
MSCWNADGDANDSCGTSNGTLVAGGYAPGATVQAFNLNGRTDYVNISGSAMSKVTGAISVSASVNPATLSVPPGYGSLAIISQYDTYNGFASHSSPVSFDLSILPGGQIEWAVVGSSCDVLSAARYIRTTSPIAANQWTNLGGTFDPATQQMHVLVNGQPVATELVESATVTSLCATSLPVRIGAAGGAGTPAFVNFFPGLIDDVKLYNSDISATSTPGPCSPPCRVEASWPFDEGTGTIAHDFTGHGHDGTLVGQTTWVPAQSATGLQFDGSTGVVQVPDTTALWPGISSFTVNATIRTTSQDPQYKWILSHYACGATCSSPPGAASASSLYALAVTGGKTELLTRNTYTGLTQDPNAVIGKTNVADGQFHKVTGVRDMVNREIRVYLDGKLDASAPLVEGVNDGVIDNGGIIGEHPVLIGARQGVNAEQNQAPYTNLFNGTIDDVSYANDLSLLPSQETAPVFCAVPSTPTNTSIAAIPQPPVATPPGLTLTARPGQPQDVRVTPCNGSASVTWRPPATTGATPITGYEVTVQPSYNNRKPAPDVRASSHFVPTAGPSGLGLLSSSLTGLVADCHQRYMVLVAAVNSQGIGPASQTGSFRPSGVVALGVAPPVVVVLIDGINEAQPRFAMNPYLPSNDGNPSFCPESWTGTQETEAGFSKAPYGPWSFFHKWNVGEVDDSGNGTGNTESVPHNLIQGDTHSFMLDALAAQGAIMLPFSYCKAALTGSMFTLNAPIGCRRRAVRRSNEVFGWRWREAGWGGERCGRCHAWDQGFAVLMVFGGWSRVGARRVVPAGSGQRR